MSNQVTLINGESYSWVQLTVNILGRNVEGISALNHETTQEKTNNRGRGSLPTSRGRGGKSFAGSITLSLEEVAAIQNALPAGKSMVDIAPFPIVVSFDNNGTLVSYILEYVEFTNEGIDVNTDTTNVERAYELIIANIKSV